MKRLLTIGAMAAMVPACMTTLTSPGAAVTLISADQKAPCRSLGILTASEAWGLSTGGDAQSAMNKIRNKVAAGHGNAMELLSVSSDGDSTTVIVEAFDCPVL